MILKYVIVCRLVRGILPLPHLLRDYQLEYFTPLLEHWKCGNIISFVAAVENLGPELRKMGCYTILKVRYEPN